MASVFLIKTDGGVTYELSSTTSASVSRSSTVAKHRVEDRSTVADNAVRGNAEISFNGIISSVRRLDQLDYVDPFQNPIDFITGKPPTPHNYKTYREYLEGIEDIMESSEFVTFFLDNDLTPITDCSITNFNYTKDYSGGITSWNVSLKGEQLRLASRSIKGNIPNPLAGVSSIVEGEKGGGVGTATVADKPLTTTILQDIAGGTGNVSIIEGFTGAGT